MDALRKWLLGVIACAMLLSLAEQLCPEGSVKKIARFTGGLLLLLAMLHPLSTVELPEEVWSAGGYREAVARLELELEAERENTFADGIAAELDAYIEDKAESLGADVRAAVTLTERGVVPTPESVTLRGTYSEALSSWITSELGIAKEKQEWIGNR